MRDEPQMLNRMEEVVGCRAPYDQRQRPSGQYWVGHEAQKAAEHHVGPVHHNATSPSEAGTYDERNRFHKYACPACDGALPHEMAAAPRSGLVCQFCHFQLWCRRQVCTDGVALEALPGPAPESWEVTRVVGNLERSDLPDSVTLDLSRFEIMSSSWVASLVRFKKLLKVSGCTLILGGLRPYICEILERLRLDTYFEIVRIRVPD